MIDDIDVLDRRTRLEPVDVEDGHVDVEREDHAQHGEHRHAGQEAERVPGKKEIRVVLIKGTHL